MLKNFRFLLALLFLFSLSTGLMGNEWANYYFPDTLGSYWVYEDQDGETFTRYAIEPQEIDGDSYRAFSYEPDLEDWAKFEHYINPYSYQISNDWIAFFVGTEVENAVKALMIQQADTAIGMMQKMMGEEFPPELDISLDIDYDVAVDSQDYFYFLPTPAAVNEPWPALELDTVLSITVALTQGGIGLPGNPAQTIETHTSILEQGALLGTETVETEAGTFEDCLIVEYRVTETTEAVAAVEIPGLPESEEREDATITTLWLAPNVGLVKFEHEHKLPEGMDAEGMAALADLIPPDRTLELIQYEIKPSESEENE